MRTDPPRLRQFHVAQSPRVKQFKEDNKIEITTFSKPAPLNTFLREWKQSETNMKEEYCWVITMWRDGHAAAYRVPVC